MRGLLVLTVVGGSVAHATLTPMIERRRGDARPAADHGRPAGAAARPRVRLSRGVRHRLLQDAAGGGLIGVQALTKAVIGFGIGVAGERLRVSQPLVQVPGLVVLTILEGLARFALLQIFRFPAPFGELMMYVVLPQALFNGFVGAAVVLSLAASQVLRERFEGQPS